LDIVVVENDMDDFAYRDRDLTLDRVEGTDELLMAMALHPVRRLVRRQARASNCFRRKVVSYSGSNPSHSA
jgi:hypothetical protein